MRLHAIDATVVPAQEPEDEVEEEDAIVEVTRRAARRGYPEPSFEGLEALRAAPKDYHELAAALASSGASIEGGDRPLLDFRRDLITSARVAAVTITVHHAKRDREIEIDEEGPGQRLLDGMEAQHHFSSHAGDIAAQTAVCVREIREATKALNPIKTKLRAFEGQKVSVPGGRVAIGVSKEAVYGYAIFVDRGVWNKLDEEVQDACVDAGLIKLKGAAAASVALTVRSIGEAPPVPRKRGRQRVRERVVHRALSFFTLHRVGLRRVRLRRRGHDQLIGLESLDRDLLWITVFVGREFITTVLFRKEIRLESWSITPDGPRWPTKTTGQELFSGS